MVTPAQLRVLRPGPPKPLEEAPRPRGDPRVQGCKGIVEDRHYRRAGEEADYSQRTLSDIVEVVGRRRGHHRHLLLREPSPLVSYDRLGLTLEDEQDLLSTVRVRSDVLFRLDLEEEGCATCRPVCASMGKLILIPALGSPSCQNFNSSSSLGFAVITFSSSSSPGAGHPSRPAANYVTRQRYLVLRGRGVPLLGDFSFSLG